MDVVNTASEHAIAARDLVAAGTTTQCVSNSGGIHALRILTFASKRQCCRFPLNFNNRNALTQPTSAGHQRREEFARLQIALEMTVQRSMLCAAVILEQLHFAAWTDYRLNDDRLDAHLGEQAAQILPKLSR
jgi:hypothetical protein